MRNLIEYVSVEGKAIYFERIKVIQSLSDHNAYEGILNLPEIFFENTWENYGHLPNAGEFEG